MALTPNTHPRRTIALAALGCALLLAACGSSSVPRGVGADNHAVGVKFSVCMRDHGVSNFPDPEANAGIQIPISLEQNASPAFTSAQQACQYLVPPGGGPPVASASQKAEALKFAQCMRGHRVSNYPDPTYQDGHEIPPPIANPALNLDSPAFQAASKACQSL
jgi:hypothetical protein